MTNKVLGYTIVVIGCFQFGYYASKFSLWDACGIFLRLIIFILLVTGGFCLADKKY
jgi:cyanate permease